MALRGEEPFIVEKLSSKGVDLNLTANGGTIYVLMIDWYVQGIGQRIRNPRHWIVIHGVRSSPTRRSELVAVYEDSLRRTGPDYWAWTSLAPTVGAAFKLSRSRSK